MAEERVISLENQLRALALEYKSAAERLVKKSRQHSILKRAVIDERKVSEDLRQQSSLLTQKLEEKNQAYQEQLRSIDRLRFNNQSLRKRCEKLKQHIKSKGQQQSWMFGTFFGGSGAPSGSKATARKSSGTVVNSVPNRTGKLPPAAVGNDGKMSIVERARVVEEELMAKIKENEQLHMRIFDLKAETATQLEEMKTKLDDGEVAYSRLEATIKKKDEEISQLGVVVESMRKVIESKEKSWKKMQLVRGISDQEAQQHTIKMASTIQDLEISLSKHVTFDDANNADLQKLSLPLFNRNAITSKQGVVTNSLQTCRKLQLHLVCLLRHVGKLIIVKPTGQSSSSRGLGFLKKNVMEERTNAHAEIVKLIPQVDDVLRKLVDFLQKAHTELSLTCAQPAITPSLSRSTSISSRLVLHAPTTNSASSLRFDDGLLSDDIKRDTTSQQLLLNEPIPDSEPDASSLPKPNPLALVNLMQALGLCAGKIASYLELSIKFNPDLKPDVAINVNHKNHESAVQKDEDDTRSEIEEVSVMSIPQSPKSSLSISNKSSFSASNGNGVTNHTATAKVSLRRIKSQEALEEEGSRGVEEKVSHSSDEFTHSMNYLIDKIKTSLQESSSNMKWHENLMRFVAKRTGTPLDTKNKDSYNSTTSKQERSSTSFLFSTFKRKKKKSKRQKDVVDDQAETDEETPARQRLFMNILSNVQVSFGTEWLSSHSYAFQTLMFTGLGARPQAHGEPAGLKYLKSVYRNLAMLAAQLSMSVDSRSSDLRPQIHEIVRNVAREAQTISRLLEQLGDTLVSFAELADKSHRSIETTKLDFKHEIRDIHPDALTWSSSLTQHAQRSRTFLRNLNGTFEANLQFSKSSADLSANGEDASNLTTKKQLQDEVQLLKAELNFLRKRGKGYDDKDRKEDENDMCTPGTAVFMGKSWKLPGRVVRAIESPRSGSKPKDASGLPKRSDKDSKEVDDEKSGSTDRLNRVPLKVDLSIGNQDSTDLREPATTPIIQSQPSCIHSNTGTPPNGSRRHSSISGNPSVIDELPQSEECTTLEKVSRRPPKEKEEFKSAGIAAGTNPDYVVIAPKKWAEVRAFKHELSKLQMERNLADSKAVEFHKLLKQTAMRLFRITERYQDAEGIVSDQKEKIEKLTEDLSSSKEHYEKMIKDLTVHVCDLTEKLATKDAMM
mmetsp:Transcript_16057/g.24195  ORF Transcript_16057/g.24195 Transcript_16057/m.24195 type:complete len:1179 (+) Transcript_16057:61-3597(+)|eukprot:CAMPEP_0167751806 /NCGR_PEP_ID=MMETSP0110_2-20121227/6784_1 /TAXON_ID=629695 /ORGANISM="Gymnochlora sp., Strain CCMP2014" /LENGTH=1178 /DNA_ID=CAMNT_0007637345 /DNA_START=45 /DNA_END=3581 /DNA_ORIENTATION=+